MIIEKIKSKKGMIVNIAERYGIKRNMLDNYITNLGQRKYIPIKIPMNTLKQLELLKKSSQNLVIDILNECFKHQ